MDHSLERYFTYGVLDIKLNHHRRMAEVIHEIAIGACIPPEMLYQFRLTDFIAPEHKVCTVIRDYPKLLQQSCAGIILACTLNDSDKVLKALVGTLNRNKVDARYRTLRELTYELGTSERVIGSALIIPDGDAISMANKNSSSYNHSSVDEVLLYCRQHGKMVIMRCEDWEYAKSLLNDTSKGLLKNYLLVE